MIVGFGFGSPLTALLMLLATSLISYALFRMFTRARRSDYQDWYEQRALKRQYYYEQRERARQMAREFDISDEEIEERLDREFGPDTR